VGTNSSQELNTSTLHNTDGRGGFLRNFWGSFNKPQTPEYYRFETNRSKSRISNVSYAPLIFLSEQNLQNAVHMTEMCCKNLRTTSELGIRISQQ